MKVQIRFETASQPVIYDDVVTTYVKAGMFVVRHEDGTNRKYPLANIFDVKETPCAKQGVSDE